MRPTHAALLAIVLLAVGPVAGSAAPPRGGTAPQAPPAGADSLLAPGTFTGLELRALRPRHELRPHRRPGRAPDRPGRPGTWRSACGGVWKTVNAGNTFTPIFDERGHTRSAA